ncbi:MAG: glycosyltransferase family 39 protein [Chloroflexi bacterium]|nr:glycosyltransferase family 39 protein [Chloroflexota bacterium]
MKRFYQPLFLGLIILLGLALRVVRLDFQPLWWDEGYSVFFATRDFATMLARTAIDIHPPFYYAVMQIWMGIFGQDAVALRWLSVVFGVAAIPLLYALAHKLFSDRRLALIAAFLLAISPFHIYYSQEVRMYGLVTLLGIASTYLFAQLLPMKSGTPQTFLLAAIYIGVTAAALYTQYYAAFIIAFQFLFAVWYIARYNRALLRWHSISELWSNSLMHWLGAWIAIGVLYLPWVIYAGPKLYFYVTSKVTHEAYPPLDPITFLARYLSAFSIGHLTNLDWLVWTSIVLVAIALIGILIAIKNRISPTLPHSFTPILTLFYLVIPLTLGYIVNLVYPFNPVHGERLLLLAAPAFYLLTAIGITALWNRRAILGALVVVVIGVISGASLYDFYTVPRYPNDDYRPLIQQMEQTALPNDLFLAIYPWQIGYLESYYHGAPLTIVETPSDTWANHPDQMQRDLDSYLAQHPRIWIAALQTLGRIVEDALDANLRPRAYTTLDTWFGTTRLEMFATVSDPLLSDHPLALSTSLSPSAKSWGVSTKSIVAGQDLVPIWFEWNVPHRDDFKLSFRLFDSKGNLWAQDDRDVESNRQRIGFSVPTGTPPGKYDLRLVAYQSNDTSLKSEALLANVNIVRPSQPNLAAIPNRMTSDAGTDIRLVGYETNTTIRPGEPSPITLFWQATHTIDENWMSVIQVQDMSGKVFANTQAPPAHGIYPTQQWQPNEIVRDPQSILVRGDTPDGDYRIVVSMIDPATNTLSRFVQVGKVTVKGRPRYFGAPSPSNLFDARFGDVAQLIGYDISQEQQNVRIILYWKALATSETSYKVFVHFNDSNGLPTFDATNQSTGEDSILPIRISISP